MVKINLNYILNKIEKDSYNLKELDNYELNNYIIKFSNLQNIQNLNEILVPCFSLVQEIANRTIGLKHYKTQLIAGVHLHNGKIVEMNTGEGKTLVSTLPITLNALNKKGVHIVTTNEYLAERDNKWMSKIFQQMNLSTGLIKNSDTITSKKENYDKNITYVTSSELVFDYLKDNTTFRKANIIQPKFNFCLIDEVDSILIDEARTPLIISQENQKSQNNKIYISEYIAPFLEKDYHFIVDKKRKDVFLTDQGIKEIQSLLGLINIYDNNNPWTLEILNALKAKYLYLKNRDYVILENKIAIIDDFSGRIMPDRRWSFGLHEAIEAKENLLLGNITSNKASITYQNFFPLYPKLAGMTGTAYSAKKEFKNIYKLDIVSISPNKVCQRIDLPDKVFVSELAKWKAVINKIIEISTLGQPILIGTSSIEKSEYLSKLLSALALSHNLLNAKPKNAKKENEIIAQAGKSYSITIATNMAGRGTDIILGGNLSFLIKELIKKNILLFLKKKSSDLNVNLFYSIFNNYNFDIKKIKEDVENIPYSLENCLQSLTFLYQKLYKENYSVWLEENQKIKKLGGLFVLGTERAESRRIDNQLRGRSGRQGDPGKSEFYLCLTDNLLNIFGGENIKKMLLNSELDTDLSISSSLIQQTILNSQQKIEDYYFQIRENVFNYESILNFERKDFYECRKNLFEIQKYEKFLINFITLICNFENSGIYYFSNILFNKNFTLTKLLGTWVFLEIKLKKYYFYKKEVLKDIFSFWFLSILDNCWINHTENVSYIKETINWNAYGQQNPLDEYYLQSEKSYNIIFKRICYFIIYYLLYRSMVNFIIT
jgi:preprotein translocase subunit SecA